MKSQSVIGVNYCMLTQLKECIMMDCVQPTRHKAWDNTKDGNCYKSAKYTSIYVCKNYSRIYKSTKSSEVLGLD